MEMGSVIVEKEKKVLTMTEYIEREVISEEIRKYYYKNPPNFSYGEGFDRGLDRAQRAILDAPAADVAPVRHGQWIFGKDLPYSWGQIPKNKYHLYCSECLEQAFNRSEDNDPDFDVDTSYCPNCGAKMDGGDGNSDMA